MSRIGASSSPWKILRTEEENNIHNTSLHEKSLFPHEATRSCFTSASQTVTLRWPRSIPLRPGIQQPSSRVRRSWTRRHSQSIFRGRNSCRRGSRTQTPAIRIRPRELRQGEWEVIDESFRSRRGSRRPVPAGDKGGPGCERCGTHRRCCGRPPTAPNTESSRGPNR
jgi:hypothetical protein